MKSNGNTKTKTTVRAAVFSLCIIVFIAVVAVLYFTTKKIERENIINAYRNQQSEELTVMASVVRHLYDDENSNERISAYLASFPSSGSRFLVYVVNDEVVYAKNNEVTATLGNLSDKTRFFDAIAEDGLCIVTDSYEVNGNICELSIVSTEDYIFDDIDYETTSYYTFVIMAVLAMSLLTIVEFIVTAWNSVEKKYGTTTEELKKRNFELETISQSLTDKEGSYDGAILDPDGIANNGSVEFYNVYTMRNLLEKSADPDLQPLHVIKLQADISRRNVSYETVYRQMGLIKDSLKGYEVMGEIKKGLFLIYIFRIDSESAFNEYERIKTKALSSVMLDFGITVEMLKDISIASFDELTLG